MGERAPWEILYSIYVVKTSQGGGMVYLPAYTFSPYFWKATTKEVGVVFAVSQLVYHSRWPDVDAQTPEPCLFRVHCDLATLPFCRIPWCLSTTHTSRWPIQWIVCGTWSLLYPQTPFRQIAYTTTLRMQIHTALSKDPSVDGGYEFGLHQFPIKRNGRELRISILHLENVLCLV